MLDVRFMSLSGPLAVSNRPENSGDCEKRGQENGRAAKEARGAREERRALPCPIEYVDERLRVRLDAKRPLISRLRQLGVFGDGLVNRLETAVNLGLKVFKPLVDYGEPLVVT
ncbi:hypothetical protein [Burkholderia sp. 8Y]|uniref:hypothetical protein n=1 Tax=Burkholderia sp. 8Y TaxID=2653133 RepID=UPI00135CC602|nr:hypothetical protein [Burkholderia sp. 8Y]